MKTGIHPNYILADVRCACGNSFQIHSTKPEYHLEICSSCHPFFTGKQKLVDSAGRVERFTKRFQKTSGKTVKSKPKLKPARVVASRTIPKTLSTGARKAAPPAPKKSSQEK